MKDLNLGPIHSHIQAIARYLGAQDHVDMFRVTYKRTSPIEFSCTVDFDILADPGPADPLPQFLDTLPIRCADGAFGLVIRDKGTGDVGVQVPGEENIRWIARDRVTNAGDGALVEVAR